MKHLTNVVTKGSCLRILFHQRIQLYLSGTHQRCLFSHHVFNVVQKSLTRSSCFQFFVVQKSLTHFVFHVLGLAWWWTSAILLVLSSGLCSFSPPPFPFFFFLFLFGFLGLCCLSPSSVSRSSGGWSVCVCFRGPCFSLVVFSSNERLTRFSSGFWVSDRKESLIIYAQRSERLLMNDWLGCCCFHSRNFSNPLGPLCKI